MINSTISVKPHEIGISISGEASGHYNFIIGLNDHRCDPAILENEIIERWVQRTVCINANDATGYSVYSFEFSVNNQLSTGKWFYKNIVAIKIEAIKR